MAYSKDISSDGSYQICTLAKYKGTYNYVVPYVEKVRLPENFSDSLGWGNFAVDVSKKVETYTGHFFCRYASILPYRMQK